MINTRMSLNDNKVSELHLYMYRAKQIDMYHNFVRFTELTGQKVILRTKYAAVC